jgi:TPR repeat protein
MHGQIVPAMFNLAYIYETGKDGVIPIDIPSAIQYYRQAAYLGQHKEACYRLGLLLSSSEQPVPWDEVIRCYSQAAEAGHVEAMYNLALIYCDEGDREECRAFRDLDKAMYLFQQAVCQGGSADAAYNLAVILESGIHRKPNEVSLEMDGDREQNMQLAILYYEQAIALAEKMRVKFGVVNGVNIEVVYSELAKAAYENNLKEADFAMGYIGLASLGHDEKRKVDHLILAAEHGLAEAWFLLQQYMDHISTSMLVCRECRNIERDVHDSKSKTSFQTRAENIEERV